MHTGDFASAQVLLRLSMLAAYLNLSVLFFVYFLEMHNNTKDGNSFREKQTFRF